MSKYSLDIGKPCPICGNPYTYYDPKITYHFEYKPQITIDACRSCYYAEYLICHPEVKSDYFMKKRIGIVQAWTLKEKPLIEP